MSNPDKGATMYPSPDLLKELLELNTKVYLAGLPTSETVWSESPLLLEPDVRQRPDEEGQR